MKYSKNNSMYVVYEKVPAHQSQVNGIILGPFASKKEAEELRKKYGYASDNYYVGPFVDIENGEIWHH